MSQAQPSENAQPGSSGNKLLSAYTIFVSSLGIALLVWSVLRISPTMPDILLFLVLVVVSEFATGTALAPQFSFSISSAVSFAALLVFGPLPAAQ